MIPEPQKTEVGGAWLCGCSGQLIERDPVPKQMNKAPKLIK